MAIMAPVCGKGEITQFLIILELGSESIMQIHAKFLGKNILQHLNLFLECVETMGHFNSVLSGAACATGTRACPSFAVRAA